MSGPAVPLVKRFRARFWLPPRPHGEAMEDRTVSFLELFYDLVYVVVIGRAAHTLAADVSWRSVVEFAVVFGMIWAAWLNGTLYYDLHGREEGRTRFYVFVQMLLLALLAVFTGEATGGDGSAFAIVYTAYLAVVSWLWYTVRRQDSEEFAALTARYLAAMLTSVAVVGVSVVLPTDARTTAWGLVVIGWMVFTELLARSPGMDTGTTTTDSLVERFGLFVIIVLGEVVVGVVDGLSETEHTGKAVLTGLIGLMIGFAYWWTYFDYVGGRRPNETSVIRTRWMFAHLPVTLSIAAAGAAMVSLVEHASDESTPAGTAWLLSGSVAVGALALVAVMATLSDFSRLPTLYRPVAQALVGASAVALGIGWLAPAPWVLALLLVLTLGAVWVFAVIQWLNLDEADTAPS